MRFERNNRRAFFIKDILSGGWINTETQDVCVKGRMNKFDRENDYEKDTERMK